MMNLNEIHPGDFVYIGDTRTTWRPEFYFKWDASGRFPLGYAEGKNTNPIPLTESFLRANGFISDGVEQVALFVVSNHENMEVYISKEGMPDLLEITIYKYDQYHDRYEVVLCRPIKYVHELQHYFIDAGMSDIRVILD